MGEQLGAAWEPQTTPVTLSGNLAVCEAKALVLTAHVGSLPPARLDFAWTRAESVPVILGQVHCFMEFDGV